MTQTRIVTVDLFDVGAAGADLSWSPSVVTFGGARYWRNPFGYYVRGVKARTVGLHRALWVMTHGPIPDWHHIHHEDGNQLNNQLSNLRCLSQWEHAALHGRERFRRGQLSSWLARRRNGRAA